MKTGDLVKECAPLMAGDVPERLGLVVETPPYGATFIKVLFDKEEMVPYNSLMKMEA